MIELFISARDCRLFPSRKAHRGFPVVTLILCVSCLAPIPCSAQQRHRLINQESALADLSYRLGTIALVVSPDGSRSVSILRDESGLAVMDGYPGFYYDELAPAMPLLSGDGAHCAYVGRRASLSVFGQLSSLWFVVFDRAESTPFSSVNGDSPVLDPDGARLAVVVEVPGGQEVRVFKAPPAPPSSAPATQPATQPQTEWWKKPVEPTKPQADVPKLASEPGRLFDEISPSSLRFSPDGKHLAYACRRGRKWRIVLDGVDSGPADGLYDEVGSPKFCGSGAMLAYVARRERKSVVVTVPIGVAGAIGVEGRPHESILQDSLAFSFDGAHLAYAAGKTGAMSVYLDGAELRLAVPPPPGLAAPFEQIAADSLRFCPDGSRFAFGATRGGEWFVVLDGVEGPHYLGIAPMTLIFSLNGKRLAYVAEALVADVNKRPPHAARCVVVDGVQQRIYDRIVAPPVFSPDGHRCAYVAERNAESFVVIDGMEGKHYGCVRGRPLLSIDGSRCEITAIADDPDNRFRAVEEVPRNPSDPSAGDRLIFDRSAGFTALPRGQQTNPVKLLLIEERVAPE